MKDNFLPAATTIVIPAFQDKQKEVEDRKFSGQGHSSIHLSAKLIRGIYERGIIIEKLYFTSCYQLP